MLGFVQNWFAPRANPIGVDFGSDCLRLAQVQSTDDDGEHKLIAAASADVPAHVKNDPAARTAFFVETARDLLAQGGFRGRTAVLGLPAAAMNILHLRMPKMEEDALRKAIPWEARGKLPIDPTHALIRHLVAGDIYHDAEPRSEVIVMAAAREMVNQFLAAAARAKLDVVGMNTEPGALIDCFTQVYRRKSDTELTNCFVDIGSRGSRAVITSGGKILFARAIPVGGEHFNRAVAASMGIAFEDAKMLRIKLARVAAAAAPARSERQPIEAPPPPPPPPPPPQSVEEAFPLLGAGLAAAEQRAAAATAVEPAPPRVAAPERVDDDDDDDDDNVPPVPAADLARQVKAVEQAGREPLNKLIEELDLCRRYYEATFPSKPVDRLVFVGGEARQRGLCQHIARELGLAAQVGDPLCRMGKTALVGIESGIDRREPQPGWAVAIGLSMGPAGAPAAEGRG